MSNVAILRRVRVILAAMVANAIFSACAFSPQETGPEVNLYSWPTKKGDYAFALVSDKNNAKFLRTFSRKGPHILGVAGLEAELSKLPRNTVVKWRDDDQNGLSYPPTPIERIIQQFAAARGVYVNVLPTLYEQERKK